MFKKGLIVAVGIIVLFLVVAVAPSIAVQSNQSSKNSADNELVEITTDACGIPGLKPHTVSLTKQQAAEVDQLFDTIKARLDAAKTREESDAILSDSVISLNKYGLLPVDMSIKQVQKLVTVGYQNPKEMKKLENLPTGKLGGGKENFNCSIVGRIVGSFFLPWKYLSSPKSDPFIADLMIRLLLSRMPVKRCINSYLAFGISTSSFEGHQYNNPSEGTISTNGEKGAVDWSGSFYGQIATIELLIYPLVEHVYYLGITGFTGIRITNLRSGVSHYEGHAVHVFLGPYPPWADP